MVSRESRFGRPSSKDEGRYAWMADAVCAQTDPESCFPEKGGTTRMGKSVCNICDVRVECLDFALANNSGGIAGNTTERQRRVLKRKAAP